MSGNTHADKASTDAVIYCRMSHPALFQPKPNKNGKLAYNVVCVIDPSRVEAETRKLKDALQAAMINRWGPRDAGKWPVGQWRGPSAIIRPVEERPSLSEFHNKGGYMFIGPNCYDQPPEVVQPDGRTVVTNPREAYPGRYAYVAVNAYWFGDQPGSLQKGLTFGLNAVQLMEDAESLGGRKNAQSYFQPQQVAGAAFGGRFDGTAGAGNEADPFGIGGGGGGARPQDNPFA